ncbi:3-hydroxyacyl-CoA dehydrogenase [Thauera phenylacetica B4P]|uniref:3-hydroxyacyl-CoA dehydrogenase n=1 Tax=Thauera phenylacetica B4P TaxID=1234382 RepID=N6ZZA5_9RHOO|nr:3-hydroxyacyl-CoA dehydrogenase NAD-binding domain-containing protein [Thauera phenylacetica]ENO97464.1 3-hydroxyacyl-CoA dehydrogenase [Thauera phenylacetica B4P]
MNGYVHFDADGDIAVIRIDNPPVNAGSIEVRSGILRSIERVAADPALKAAILIGVGKTFIAGSDLREFGQPLASPQLPDVIAAIEGCPKPVVAALHGAALGGGYELALGCDARVAAAGTLVGLPEVTLGIIPGAGGTQRLPRLVGQVAAIDLICSGKRVEAAEAKALGMIDAVAEGDLRAFAVAFARRLKGEKRPIRNLCVREEDAAAVYAAETAALEAGRKLPQVRDAIEAVRTATIRPFDEALATEREAFQRLRIGRAAFALRHQFFAERDSAKLPEIQDIPARAVERVAVIGAGTMGAGIALASLAAGYAVTLLEESSDALERGLQRIGDHYARRTAAGKMTADEAGRQQARLTASTDEGKLADVQLVIEAVFEDLAVKQALFRRIERIVPAHVVLASNTSYLDLDAIAEATRRPHNVIGLHFFSPANVMRLLEVVRGAYTAPDVLATGFAVGKRLGKLPILTGNAFGFIGNRIYAAYRKQCEFMLEEGALPQEIDAAVEAFGFAMGPFAVADLSGLDIAWRMRQAGTAARDPEERYVAVPDRLCEMNRLGRKTGAGYYSYPEQGKRGRPDPVVARLIAEESAAKGIVRRPFTPEQIVRRVLLTMANEAALLLAEGVTTRLTDVDLVMVNGFGFPKWEGGPAFWACCELASDPASLEADLDAIAIVSGTGFVRGELALLRRMMPEGRVPAKQG